MKRKKSGGYILIVTVLVIAAIFFYALMLVRLYVSEKQIARKGETDIIAEQAARAGIEDALYQLKRDQTWKAGFSGVTLSHSGASYYVSFDKKQTKIPFSINNSNSSSAVSGYDGRLVPPGFAFIISVGVFGNSRVEERAMFKLAATPYTDSLFGIDSIVLSGTIFIDSYNSSLGTYAQTKTLSGGNIGTNASAPKSVTLKNVNINGAVIVGPGGSQATLNIIGTPYYQSFQVASQARPVDDVVIPNLRAFRGDVSVTQGQFVTLSPGVYTNLTAKGGTIELTPGEYVVTQNINLSAGANILVRNGQVKLYVLGNIYSQSSSFTNLTGRSSNFLLFGGPNSQEFDLQGLRGANLSFAIYAPRATLSFGGGNEFYGSFFARQVLVNGNANFHYDRELATVKTGGPSSPELVVRW